MSLNGAFLRNIILSNDNNNTPDALHFYSQQASTSQPIFSFLGGCNNEINLTLNQPLKFYSEDNQPVILSTPLVDVSVDSNIRSNISITKTTTFIDLPVDYVGIPISSQPAFVTTQYMYDLFYLFDLDSDGNYYAYNEDGTKNLDGTPSTFSNSGQGYQKYDSNGVKINLIPSIPYDAEYAISKNVDTDGFRLTICDYTTIATYDSNFQLLFEIDYPSGGFFDTPNYLPNGDMIILSGNAIPNNGNLNSITVYDVTSQSNFSVSYADVSDGQYYNLTVYDNYGEFKWISEIFGKARGPFFDYDMGNQSAQYQVSDYVYTIIIGNVQKVIDGQGITHSNIDTSLNNFTVLQYDSLGTLLNWCPLSFGATHKFMKLFSDETGVILLFEPTGNHISSTFSVNSNISIEPIQDFTTPYRLFLLLKLDNDCQVEWVIPFHDTYIERSYIIDDRIFLYIGSGGNSDKTHVITDVNNNSVEFNQYGLYNLYLLIINTAGEIVAPITEISDYVEAIHMWKNDQDKTVKLADYQYTNPTTYESYYGGGENLVVNETGTIVTFQDQMKLQNLYLSANDTSIHDGFIKRLTNSTEFPISVIVTDAIDQTNLQTIYIPKYSTRSLIYRESHSNWLPLDSLVDTENIIDNAVNSSKLASNLSLAGDTTFEGNILTSTHNTYDIGSSSAKFRAAYFTVGYFTSSDLRLKKDLIPIEAPLEKIQSLSGYTYSLIDDPSHARHAGLIAQDVVKVLPEAVSGDEQLSINYDSLVPLLVEAVKKLKAELEDVKAAVHKN